MDILRRRILALAAAPVVALLLPGNVTGQVVPLDDAVFEITRGGTVIGEEHVTLHRMGLGQDARILGQSEIRLSDGSELRPRVEATTDMRATTYQNKFTGAEEGEVVVSRAGRRLVARTRTAAGEAQREFRASDRTLLLEPGVVLLYYLLQPWMDAGETVLTVLDPRTGDEERLILRPAEVERLRLGRDTRQATRIRLEDEQGVVRHEVWFDEDGRILQVHVADGDLWARRQRS